MQKKSHPPVLLLLLQSTPLCPPNFTLQPFQQNYIHSFILSFNNGQTGADTLNLGKTPPPRAPQKLVPQSTFANSGFGHYRMQTYMVAAMCQQAHSNSTCVHTHLTASTRRFRDYPCPVC